MGNYIIVGLHFCYSRYSNKYVCVYRHTKYRAMNCSIKKKKSVARMLIMYLTKLFN